MVSTYSDFQGLSRSEKIVLCHIEPAERLLIWTLDSGAVYYRDTDHFVIDVKDGTTSLIEGSSSSLSAGEWWYDSAAGRCYIRMSDDSNPNTGDIVGYYRLFYANAPLSLPYDLSTGADVYYKPHFKSNSAITKQIDEEQVGIALESSTKVQFFNDDGDFDDTFDTLFFENKTLKLYSWSPLITIDKRQLLFEGEIQDKTYSPSMIGFSCKDQIFKLREKLNLSLFTSSDGNVPDAVLDTPKRRVIGQVDELQCIPIDNVLDGYTLTGTLASVGNTATFTGTGTSFLDEVSSGDKLTIILSAETIEVGVESVDSDTQITVSEDVISGFNGQSAINSPTRPYRKKNRSWSIAGHKLRQPTTTVSSASQANRLVLADGSDMFDDDLISIDGVNRYIKRIVGNEVVLTQNLPTVPSGGEAVIKNPLSKAYLGKDEIFIDRDWTITNTTEAKLILTNTAEFNLAPQRTLPATSVTFTNGSRTVTGADVNFNDYVQTRDWVKSDDLTHTTWYEVLSVTETSLDLRIAYAGANNTGDAYRKLPKLVEDETLVLVDCIGLESSGTWIKTASDAVNNLISSDAGLTNINSASFTEADSDAPHTLSMVIPESVGGSIPTIKDVISNINKSVFGSLVTNTDGELVYNILTPDKPETLSALENDDIVGDVRVRSRNEIVRQVNLKYRAFVDRFTGEDSFKLSTYTSTFVDTYIGSRQELDITAYLYGDNDATEISERYALYNSLSQSTVTVKGKLNLSTKNLNEKIWLNLDRLYKRFGGRNRQKIGIINKVSTDGLSSTVEFNDLGNIFNRVMSIAPNTASDFTSATEAEKIVNGYVLDSSLEVPDTSSDQELGSIIIG